MLLTLYLRREPTIDSVWAAYGDGRRKWDVVAYRDAGATTPAGRFLWFSVTRPRRGARRMTLNCWRWNVVWLPDRE